MVHWPFWTRSRVVPKCTSLNTGLVYDRAGRCLCDVNSADGFVLICTCDNDWLEGKVSSTKEATDESDSADGNEEQEEEEEEEEEGADDGNEDLEVMS